VSKCKIVELNYGFILNPGVSVNLAFSYFRKRMKYSFSLVRKRKNFEVYCYIVGLIVSFGRSFWKNAVAQKNTKQLLVQGTKINNHT
jgi:hypothetical protein